MKSAFDRTGLIHQLDISQRCTAIKRSPVIDCTDATKCDQVPSDLAALDYVCHNTAPISSIVHIDIIEPISGPNQLVTSAFKLPYLVRRSNAIEGLAPCR